MEVGILKNTRMIILTITVVGIVLVGVCLYYTHYMKEGILWRYGLSRDSIKLSTRIDRFEFYLYEKNKEIGLFSVYKREGHGWKKYYDLSKVLESDRDSLEFLYPTIQNGAAVTKSLWGGVIKSSAFPDAIVKINNEIYPLSVVSFKKNEYLYFLITSDETGGKITIESK